MSSVVSDRLDDLCHLLNEQGVERGTVYRHDLVEALIASAPDEVPALIELMERYVGMTAREAVVGGHKGAQVIPLRAVRPGRR